MTMCDITTKVCSKCGEEKPITSEYFYSRKDSKDGFFSYCKICSNKQKSEWKKNNRERDTNNQREWRENNKKYLKEYNRKWKQKNKEHLTDYQKQFREDNKEYFKEYWKNYYRNNTDKLSSKKNTYTKERYNSDPLYKLKVNVRNNVRRMISIKKTKTQSIIGCDWSTFKEHIEKQFQEGMTWDNHGEWHYDHIIPISSAKTEEEVYKLNHYTNFQPLWVEDNLKKSDKISEEWGNVLVD